MARRPTCLRGCRRYSKLPDGAYFRYCGPIVQARIERGEPFAAYKKVAASGRGRGMGYSGGAIEMLLKDRGWGPAARKGGKAARYYPVKGDPCVFQLSRDWAARHAEKRALFAMTRDARKRRAA